MTIDEMKKAKKELGYSYEKIADLAQMTPEGVRRIFLGKVSKPRYASMKALEGVLRPYNVEKYWEFTEECRGEMLNGVWYGPYVPTCLQQMLIGDVYTQLRCQMERQQIEGAVLFSPVSVSLHGDIYTMVQPDVIVVEEASKLKSWGVLGALDFVFEILSTSAQKKKEMLKLEHYTRAGVREYWVLDLCRKEVTVHRPGTDSGPAKYPLAGRLGLHILEGRISLDLSALSEIIDAYEGKEPGETLNPVPKIETEN